MTTTRQTNHDHNITLNQDLGSKLNPISALRKRGLKDFHSQSVEKKRRYLGFKNRKGVLEFIGFHPLLLYTSAGHCILALPPLTCESYNQ